jgi:NAD(P)-dependent dehydrogenase (short-subunit alcohol dehydrogenase family)
MELTGKVAIVTGAYGIRSIGRAVALKLASEGADVVVTDIDHPADRIADEEARKGWTGIDDVAAEVRALGRRSAAIPCDLSSEAQIESLIASTVTEFGRLDILVNTARAFMKRDRVAVLDMTEAEWDWIMAINARAPMTMSRHAAKQMIAEGHGGSIVHVSSMMGKRPMPGGLGAAYGASKGALNMLIKSLAHEVAPFGIRANAVSPGLTATSRVSPDEKREAVAAGVSYEEYRKKWLAERGTSVPIGRAAEPEEVANAVYFLVSDLSSYMIGQCLNVDGGEVME